jgi:hypothetical protein
MFNETNQNKGVSLEFPRVKPTQNRSIDRSNAEEVEQLPKIDWGNRGVPAYSAPASKLHPIQQLLQNTTLGDNGD